MTLKKFLMVAVVAAVLVACGDDDSSDFATRPSGDSSSACEDCDGSSSSKAKSSSSSSVTPKSSESETSVSSSSLAKSSSSAASSSSKDVEPVETSSSSSSVDFSSSSVMSSSSSDGSSSCSAMSSSSDGSSSSVTIESSSSSVKSSSSMNIESSSSEIDPAALCKTETEDNCEYGTLTDDRDGQTYKTVKIGDQWWMAENLNYAYTGVPYKYTYIDSSYTSDSTSWCYDNDPANCTKYGRLYTWAAAMDSVGTWSTNGKGCGYGKRCTPTYPVRGVCPEGWHLPTKAEFETLFTAVGGSSTAGRMLKSTSGWNDSKGRDGNGTDAYAFSALPAGEYFGGYYGSECANAYFWSSTERNSNYAYIMLLFYYDDYAYLDNYDKYYGYSVRCLKD